MQQLQPSYKFYATLLDAYQWYRVSESDNAAAELIDKINRVRTMDAEAIQRMNRGTALNNLVDLAIESGVVIDSYEIDGVHYSFPESLVLHLAEKLHGSIIQYRANLSIIHNGKVVELYGYTDYVLTDSVIDLKTTASYELGEYANSMQRHLYPIALIANGNQINRFEFIAVEIKSGYHNVYSESYPVDDAESMAVVRDCISGLIEFIEANRYLITDRKIFGLDELTTIHDNGVIVFDSV